jgi:hypothetical protein
MSGSFGSPTLWRIEMKEVPVPKVNKYTNENFVIAPNMIDEDNGESCCAKFDAGASIAEGVSGRKSIDTLFENTSQDIVESPRSMTTSPANPDDLDQYPHRRL